MTENQINAREEWLASIKSLKLKLEEYPRKGLSIKEKTLILVAVKELKQKFFQGEDFIDLEKRLKGTKKFVIKQYNERRTDKEV